MKASFAVAVVLTFFLAFSGIVSAENKVTVDLNKLSPQDAARVLELRQATSNDKPVAEKVEAWLSIGEKMGRAIAATSKELSVQANEFIKTPVGKMTVVVILWKAVGKDLWHIVGGIAAWITIMAIILWSFSFFHMKKKVRGEDKDGNVVIEYVERYEFASKDAKVGSAACHVAAFVILTIVSMAIVFA